MRSEEELIEALATDVRPVRRLRSPFSRTIFWIVVSGIWAAAVVAFMGLRPDLGAKSQELRWVVEQAATLATAYFAAMAAFCAVVPGRPRWEHAVPLIPLGIWLGTLGFGCYLAWSESGLTGLIFIPDWACFPAIVFVGAGPAVVMAAMLRRGAPITPALALALGALASSALGDFGLRFFHPQDASLVVLVWQVGTVFVLTAMGAAAGPTFLKWRSPQIGSTSGAR